MPKLHNFYNFDYFTLMFFGTFPAFRFIEHNINPMVNDAGFRTSDSEHKKVEDIPSLFDI